ncbi:MAG: hypothetical protein JSV63_01175 [Candidatus Aenigmatarchaeota archaeon]|nr:MAG: hypothetical protein JSV63_01175 [Candidatus Aenigmarchaeota archaeon]
MEEFSKVRTGIAALKKEREELRKNYEFVSSELSRLAENNAKSIKELYDKSESFAAFEKSVKESISTIDNKFVSGISLLNRTSDEQSSLLKDQDSAIQRLTLSLQAVKKDIEAENERTRRVKESAEENKRKLELIGKLEAKIKHIEDVKAGLIKGVESLKNIKTDMAALEQKTKDLASKLTDADKFLESRLLEKTRMLDSQIADKTDAMVYQMEDRLKLLESNIVKRNNEVISKVNLDLTGIGKDIVTANKMISSLKTEGATTKKRFSEIDAIRHRVEDVEKLGDAISGNLAEIKHLQKNIADLRKDVDSSKIVMKDVDAAIDKKMDYNISSIKKEAALNSATLTKLEQDLNRFSLDLNSVKKDIGSSGTNLGKLSSAVEKLQKKIVGLEKLQVKLGEMGDAKQALTEAMEAQLEERIKFLDTSLRQKAENIEAGILEKSKASESRLNTDINTIKKELSGKSKTIDSVKTRLEKIGRLEERLKNIDRQKDVITKNVTSLQEMKAGMTKMDERSRNLDRELRALKAQVDSGFADVRGAVDTKTTEEDNKFSTAVKAFLNARGDLNRKISLLDLKIADNNKRLNDFSKTSSRIDLLERKLDRLSEKDAAIRRDVDDLERKGGDEEKVMVVDLGKDE